MNGSWADRRLERVLVYGLGLSGRAAARLLLARGAAVLALDDKDVDADHRHPPVEEEARGRLAGEP